MEAQDTSVIAQLGWPDMRLPLLYSLSWPHRVRMSYDQLDLAKLCETCGGLLCGVFYVGPHDVRFIAIVVMSVIYVFGATSTASSACPAWIGHWFSQFV